MSTIKYLLLIYILMISAVTGVLASTQPVWYEKDKDGQAIIHLYFFWSEKCPHCLQARPDILAMDDEYTWLKLHSLELVNHPDNVNKFIAMASMFNQEARSVPTFMFCGNLMSGYETKQTTGEYIRESLQACYQFVKKENPDNSVAFNLSNEVEETIDIPLFGNISSADYSLPVLTILIASMDAFNPCAFFVLLFLLSMMAHGQSRKRMALIGVVFVFFSGAMYFLFMAAWLNLFIYIGELRLITLLAGGIAILIALINIKDYFWFKKGISLTISDKNKPEIFERIRKLLKFDSILTVVLATIVLAIVANSYELLCTAGFPMIFTRILTLKSLPIESYYLYLVLYNLIYVLPLLMIVIFFTVKLGSRKLSAKEGMLLKLLSGNMMLLLGVLLVIAPQLLSNVLVAIVILFMAVFLTWGIVKLTQPKNLKQN